MLPVQDGGVMPSCAGSRQGRRPRQCACLWLAQPLFFGCKITRCHGMGSSLPPQWRPPQCQATMRL